MGNYLAVSDNKSGLVGISIVMVGASCSFRLLRNRLLDFGAIGNKELEDFRTPTGIKRSHICVVS